MRKKMPKANAASTANPPTAPPAIAPTGVDEPVLEGDGSTDFEVCDPGVPVLEPLVAAAPPPPPPCTVMVDAPLPWEAVTTTVEPSENELVGVFVTLIWTYETMLCVTVEPPSVYVGQTLMTVAAAAHPKYVIFVAAIT
jgi:hypothetical protein